MKIVLEHPKNPDVTLEVEDQIALDTSAFEYQGEIYVYRHESKFLRHPTFEWIPAPYCLD